MSIDATDGQRAEAHLLIAGTGRAGTSFLVRYLDALGLDTALSEGRPTAAAWSDEANAGLETLPLLSVTSDMPYVIKSPWSFEVIDEMLADPRMRLDAVIVPMRDLVEAASSRTILELRQMHAQAPWMSDLEQGWETWGRTAGGTIYSLNPVDQARLLAVGFHHLVHRVTQADVPMLFLDFPRFVQDPDYLYAQLRPVLPEHVTLEDARRVHASTADPAGKVRVGAELGRSPSAPMAPASMGSGPKLADLDRIALARELKRRTGEVAALQAELNRLERRSLKGLARRALKALLRPLRSRNEARESAVV